MYRNCQCGVGSFYQAYYMYMAMQDKSNIKLAAKNLKDFFDIEV